jgi:hypothetical protein
MCGPCGDAPDIMEFTDIMALDEAEVLTKLIFKRLGVIILHNRQSELKERACLESIITNFNMRNPN